MNKDNVKDKTDYDNVSESTTKAIPTSKVIKKERPIILGYKIILKYPEYKYMLDHYTVDENGEIVCDMYTNVILAKKLMNNLSQRGVYTELREIYRKSEV